MKAKNRRLSQDWSWFGCLMFFSIMAILAFMATWQSTRGGLAYLPLSVFSQCGVRFAGPGSGAGRRLVDGAMEFRQTPRPEHGTCWQQSCGIQEKFLYWPAACPEHRASHQPWDENR